MNLWLDDIRDPRLHGHFDWMWVKTYDEAITALSSYKFDKVSLDHDLTVNQTIGYDDGEKTGFDVLCWMEKRNIWPVCGVTVHSMNLSGKKRMEQIIRKHSGRNF